MTRDEKMMWAQKVVLILWLSMILAWILKLTGILQIDGWILVEGVFSVVIITIPYFQWLLQKIWTTKKKINDIDINIKEDK